MLTRSCSLYQNADAWIKKTVHLKQMSLSLDGLPARATETATYFPPVARTANIHINALLPLHNILDMVRYLLKNLSSLPTVPVTSPRVLYRSLHVQDYDDEEDPSAVVAVQMDMLHGSLSDRQLAWAVSGLPNAESKDTGETPACASINS